MFKIYLSRKLHETETQKQPIDRKNRRLSERFELNDQHVMALNNEEVVRLKDISARGFSCEVSPQTYKKFEIGDAYDAQLRYLGKDLEAQIKVAWKSGISTGFELINPSQETLSFFKRLLFPMEIASSLKKVEAQFMSANLDNKIWYHGESGCDFILWRDSEGQLEAWQLIVLDKFIEWNESGGLRTGITQTQNNSVLNPLESLDEQLVPDDAPNPEKIRLATDILAAIASEDSKDVISTLMEEPWDYESKSTKTDEN